MFSAFRTRSVLFALVGFLVLEKLNQRGCGDLVLGFSYTASLLVIVDSFGRWIGQALEEIHELWVLIDRALTSVFARPAARDTTIGREFDGWRSE